MEDQKSEKQPMTLDQLELQLTRTLKVIDTIFGLMASEIAVLNKKLADKSAPTA